MVRNVVLIVASASIILVAYAAYTYQDGGVTYARTRYEGPPPAEAMASVDGPVLNVKQTTVRGGDKPYVVVYDADGEPKYQFRSTKWEPISEVEFNLVHPEICVFMPGGEKTRIEADHGRVYVERTKGNNLDPKRGHLRGNVIIFIDRTDKAWRRAHPELADPEHHSDRVIKIWMDEVRFDLDQSYIKSKGTLRVQSPEVEIEGQGLTLAWNERDNRIEELVIEKGKFMELRRGGSLVSFGMPGQEREGPGPRSRPAAPPEKAKARQELKQAAAMVAMGMSGSAKSHPSAFIRRAVAQGAAANKPLALEEIYPRKKQSPSPGQRTGRFSDKPAKPHKKITLFKPDGKSRISKKRDQIDTYLAVFEGDVIVEQRRGLKMLGRLSGVDRLEMLFDVGEKQRKTVRGRPQPDEPSQADKKTSSPSSAPTLAGAAVSQPASAPTSQPKDRTRLRLMWNGRLVMRPVPEAKKTGQQFDVRATGREVHIMDNEGEVVCKRLIFSNETEQAWLYGGAEGPVRMWSGKTRRLQGQEIYLDRKTGIAVVNGPGSMTDTRQALAAIAFPGTEPEADKDGSKSLKDERIEISWTRQVELDFSAAPVTRRDPATGREVTKQREYIKEAAFRGQVRMKQGDQHISADEIVMTMGLPDGAKGFVGPILAVRAADGVTLNHQDSEIRSERLSVTMAVDESGRNVPKSATAYGNVLAKQGERHIRAKDLLSVEIGETRQPTPTTQTTRPGGLPELDPDRLAKVKVLAAMKGIQPEEIDELLRTKGLDVAALKAFARSKKIDPDVVTKLIEPAKARPRLAITEMHAFGDVVADDPKQKLGVEAEELHCTLPDGKTIDRATVIAKPSDQARAELGDYVVHGHRIEIDLEREFAEVPDKGWLRFRSRQGLDGRRLDRPVPTKVEWSKQMRLEGKRNVGLFVGDVIASSEASRLECDRLKIDFEDLPPAESDKKKEKAAKSRWEFVGQWLSSRSRSGSEPDEGALRRRINKKPIAALAEGNVVVVSSVFDKEQAKRLLSRLRIAGPKLSVDLQREQLDVIGSGSLLIEDYRLPSSARQPAMRRPSRPKDPLLGDLGGRGPSQTVFTWANSMTYFLANNLAVLDRSVSMVHLSGSAMVMAKDMARAMNVDISKLRMKGRKAALTCDNLTVEFLRSNQSSKGSTPFDPAGAAELKRLIATGNIYLEDAGRSVVGEELNYRRDTNQITVTSSPGNEARLFLEDAKSGRMSFYLGPLIRLNRNSGDIHAPGARVFHSR